MATRRRGPRTLGRTAPVVFLLLWLARPAPLTAAPLLSLAVHDNACECVLPTDRDGDQYYLILGSLTQAPGRRRVTVRTEATDAPAAVPLYAPEPDPAWARRVRELGERLARARQRPGAEGDYPPAAGPPRRRTFHLFAREHDFANPASYVAVEGELRAVGRHCQVYVDRNHPDAAGLQPTVDDVVRTFDAEVYPQSRRSTGRALDVDRDGRFTVLLSGWLDRLSGGKVALGGFVRGSDFYRDLAAPFGNRCDMMYLNTSLKPGPHLRTLLAHEYTHAVVFSEHVFGGYLPGVPGQDEESWLNEALAHLTEDAHGYSWSNLDYRVSAYLSAPERYPLVVADYYGRGLWRCPGTRGSTYLFLRWCADRYGPELPARLVRSSLNGVANLEAATQEHFAELFRRWSAALVLSGSGVPADGVAPLRRLDPRRPLAERLLGGPRPHPLPLAGGEEEVRLAGTAVAFVLLHS